MKELWNVVRNLGNAGLRVRFAQQDLEDEHSTPEHFAAMVRQDAARWGKIIKTARIQAQ